MKEILFIDDPIRGRGSWYDAEDGAPPFWVPEGSTPGVEYARQWTGATVSSGKPASSEEPE